MSTYARLNQINGINTVAEIITPPTIDGAQISIANMFTADFVATLVDVTEVMPQPQQWWTYDGTTFQPPA